MRWNCPYCEEPVTADIAFENTPKAFVRCTKCNGLALIHGSAALADHVKAKPAEIAASSANMGLPPPPPNPTMIKAMNVAGLVEEACEIRAASAPVLTSAEAPPVIAPVFNFPKPPAFLLKPTPTGVEAIEKSFGFSEIGANETRKTKSPAQSSIPPTIALWTAAALAISSGIYLYIEGKKALAPVVAPAAPAQADEIHSKANSALRAGVHALVVVRVPRAILRNGPAINAEAIQTLDQATIASLVEVKEGWMKIESPKITTTDRTAWVRADLVARMPD